MTRDLDFVAEGANLFYNRRITRKPNTAHPQMILVHIFKKELRIVIVLAPHPAAKNPNFLVPKREQL